jgi:anti-sigma B factor antagonist
MQWTSRQSDTALIGSPHGVVDETTWQSFEADILAAIGEATKASLPLIVDLASLDYMSSKGLRVLTIANKAAKAAGIALSLARPNARMAEILAISQYDKIIPVSPVLED